jgi:hypothetical protein
MPAFGHDRVQTPEAFDGRPDQAVVVLRRANVHDDRSDVLGPELLLELGEALLATCSDDHLRPLLDKQTSSSAPDTCAGAGDSDDGVGERSGLGRHRRLSFRIGVRTAHARPAPGSIGRRTTQEPDVALEAIAEGVRPTVMLATGRYIEPLTFGSVDRGLADSFGSIKPKFRH